MAGASLRLGSRWATNTPRAGSLVILQPRGSDTVTSPADTGSIATGAAEASIAEASAIATALCLMCCIVLHERKRCDFVALADWHSISCGWADITYIRLE